MLKDVCMIIIYVMTKKNTQPIITLRKWLTACHRKNVEVYNVNSYHNQIFLESLYINLKTNTV